MDGWGQGGCEGEDEAWTRVGEGRIWLADAIDGGGWWKDLIG